MKENEKKTSASIKAINFKLLGGGVVIAMSQYYPGYRHLFTFKT